MIRFNFHVEMILVLSICSLMCIIYPEHWPRTKELWVKYRNAK